MRLPVRWAVLSKDVGQLQGWLGQGLRPATGFAGVGVHVVEWADGGGHNLRAHASIPCGGVDAAVAEQDLDDTDIGTVLQKMCGERVAQGLLILLMICTQQRFAIGVIPSVA